MEESRRQRSESSIADDVSHATHIAVSYIDKHYPQYKSVSIVVTVSANAITPSGVTLHVYLFARLYKCRWNFYIYNSRNSGSVIVITLKLFSCISMHFERKIADRSPKELPYFSETKRYVNTIKI